MKQHFSRKNFWTTIMFNVSRYIFPFIEMKICVESIIGSSVMEILQIPVFLPTPTQLPQSSEVWPKIMHIFVKQNVRRTKVRDNFFNNLMLSPLLVKAVLSTFWFLILLYILLYITNISGCSSFTFQASNKMCSLKKDSGQTYFLRLMKNTTNFWLIEDNPLI